MFIICYDFLDIFCLTVSILECDCVFFPLYLLMLVPTPPTTLLQKTWGFSLTNQTGEYLSGCLWNTNVNFLPNPLLMWLHVMMQVWVIGRYLKLGFGFSVEYIVLVSVIFFTDLCLSVCLSDWLSSQQRITDKRRKTANSSRILAPRHKDTFL